MIKARAIIANKDVVVIGLSRENTNRLHNNQPIMFSGSEIGLPGMRFLVLAGETEADIIEDLRSVGLDLREEH